MYALSVPEEVFLFVTELSVVWTTSFVPAGLVAVTKTCFSRLCSPVWAQDWVETAPEAVTFSSGTQQGVDD